MKKLMQKLIFSTAVTSSFAGNLAQAEDIIPAHTFTANVTVATDYRFRGISQTFKEPTIQGGFDYAHSSGFYLGNWNSNVSNHSFTDGSVEMDVYGGYKWAVRPELNADVGVLHYIYPGARISGGARYNTTELYIAGSYKWLTAKYSHSVSDFFGTPDSKGSGYLDLSANFEVADKTTLSLHAGHQKVRHAGALDYTDYKIAVSRDVGFATIGLALIGTDADDALYTYSNGAATKAKNLGDTTAVLSLSKAF